MNIYQARIRKGRPRKEKKWAMVSIVWKEEFCCWSTFLAMTWPRIPYMPKTLMNI